MSKRKVRILSVVSGAAHLKTILEETKLFKVDVATCSSGKSDGFAPKFSDYDVVVSNYNGAEWPEATKRAFVEYVANGKPVSRGEPVARQAVRSQRVFSSE